MVKESEQMEKEQFNKVVVLMDVNKNLEFVIIRMVKFMKVNGKMKKEKKTFQFTNELN